VHQEYPPCYGVRELPWVFVSGLSGPTIEEHWGNFVGHVPIGKNGAVFFWSFVHHAVKISWVSDIQNLF
jgi:hypothetical protein